MNNDTFTKCDCPDLPAINAALVAALQAIADAGTHYPPNWELYTPEDRANFPPWLESSAKIAQAALNSLKG